MATPKLFTDPTTHRKPAPSDRKLGYSLQKLQTVHRLVLCQLRPEPKTVLLLHTPPPPPPLEDYNYESFLGVMNATPSLNLAGIL